MRPIFNWVNPQAATLSRRFARLERIEIRNSRSRFEVSEAIQ